MVQDGKVVITREHGRFVSADPPPRSLGKEIIQPILRCNPEDKSCWGPKAWEGLRAICDVIPCNTCKEHCYRMISFEHDVLNKLQGKKVFNYGNVEQHLKTILRAFPEAKGIVVRQV